MAPLRQPRRAPRRDPPLYGAAPDQPADLPSPDSSDSPPAIVTHLPFAPGSSHTRNRKEGHIPRPPNAFMVFRSWLWNKDNLKNIERDNRNVSRIAGRYWNELSEAERAPFRCMAEEAKRRHAQLYPQYRYSPASQKKPKAPHRRPQRTADADKEKCDKVADMLLGGLTTHDLAKYLGEEHNKATPEEHPPAVEQASLAPSLDAIPYSTLEIPGESPPSRMPDTFLPRHPVPPPPNDMVLSSTYPATEQRSEIAPASDSSMYPLHGAEGFVATDDIPHLSLDSCNDWMFNKTEADNIPPLFPSHLEPAAHTIFPGIKPGAVSFVDSCVLGAHTTIAPIMPAPVPFTDFEIATYSSLESALVPLGSPVFTNPFEPSTSAAGHTAFFGTLDQMFGQSISPLTPIFPTETW